MANKNVKVVKKSKTKTFNWNKVFFYLKTLVNNGIVKEVGIRHWISSIFIFFLSIFISVIPVLTTEATRQGSTGINNQYNDILTEGLYDYVNNSEAPDLQIIDHELLVVGSSAGSESFFTKEIEQTNHRIDFYFIDAREGNMSFTDQANSIIENNPNLQSRVFFGTDYFQIYIVNPNTMQAMGMASGGYNHMEDIPSFKEYIKEGVDTSLSITEVKSAYMNNLYSFVNDGYLDLRGQQVGMYTGICLAINGGITLIVVPVLFLMARGKNNPNRTLKFYQIMGITFHSTLSPAIVALIIGYIMGGTFQYMSMLFVMCFGFRAMWLAMKYLRPPVEY